MTIDYHGEIPAYISKLKKILDSEDPKKRDIKVEVEFENAFHYARSLSFQIEKIGSEKLTVLKDLGLEPIYVPFKAMPGGKLFIRGEMASYDEVKQAYEILETYNTLQSIQKMPDRTRKTTLENMLYGIVREKK